MEISQQIADFLQDCMNKINTKFGQQQWESHQQTGEEIVGVHCGLSDDDEEDDGDLILGLFPTVEFDVEPVIFDNGTFTCTFWIDDDGISFNAYSAYVKDSNDLIIHKDQHDDVGNQVVSLLGLMTDD